MTEKYDVVISGAGPSGCSCAIALKKKGINVLLVDKKKFPRFKLCGGMFTNKSYREYKELLGGDEIIKKAIIDESNIFMIYNRYNKVAESKETEISFKIIDRQIFDNNLFEYYKSLNGKYIEGHYIKKLNNKTIIMDNNEEIEFDRLIIAEGAISSTRNQLKINNEYLGFCLETTIDATLLKTDYNKQNISIFFNVIKNGYAWIFPYGRYVKIGFGNSYNKDIDYKNEFIKYVKTITKADIDKIEILGAYIPFGRSIDYSHEYINLIGDSGGYVDPIYGEGIYFAVKTGKILAEAIYDNKCSDEIFKDVKRIINGGYSKQKLLFNSFISNLFFMFIKNKSRFLKFYADNMVQEYNYSYNELLKLGVDYEKNKNLVN